MQKTKPISKQHHHSKKRPLRDFSSSLFTNISPLINQEAILSIFQLKSLQSEEDALDSLQSFINQLQQEKNAYYSFRILDQTGITLPKQASKLSQINQQYAQRMQGSPAKMANEYKKISFEEKARVRYYKEEEPPSELMNYEEYQDAQQNDRDSKPTLF